MEASSLSLPSLCFLILLGVGALVALVLTFCIRTVNAEVVVENSPDYSELFLLVSFLLLLLFNLTNNSFLTNLMPENASKDINSSGSLPPANDVKLVVIWA